MFQKAVIVLYLFFISIGSVIAQDTIPNRSENSSNSIKSRGYNKKQNLQQLDDAIENKDQSSIASQYEKIAEENKKNNEHEKAIHNYKQALNIYTKSGNKTKQSEINRKIAQSQERLNKNKEAVNSYKMAEKTASSKAQEIANSNDASRLTGKQDIQSQRDLNVSNAQIFESEGKEEEAANSYQMQADLELEHNQIKEATNTLRQALDLTKDKEQKTEIERKLATVLAKDRQYTDAVSLSRKILTQAIDSNDIILQIDQLTQLSNIYQQQEKSDSTLHFLNEAYNVAMSNHLTKEAKNITSALVAHFQNANNVAQTIFYQNRFIQDLDSLLLMDKTLIDDPIALSLEQRISDLEGERVMQDEIIQSKNRFNTALLVSMAILFILVFAIFRSLHSIKRKNKRIALQSLRKEMNPHFIFNSLNSVNQFIAENNELEANKYLTSYSGLMRNVMEHSNKDFVKLSTELEQLKKYLELEHLRFRDKFDYNIIVSEEIDSDAVLIPNMLIQPQLENAIWHGLRYKEGKGRLSVQFIIEDGQLVAKVKDDGIGINRSEQMKTQHQRSHKSIGLQNTKQRIELLNQLYNRDMRLNIFSDDGGTTIYFDFGKISYQTLGDE